MHNQPTDATDPSGYEPSINIITKGAVWNVNGQNSPTGPITDGGAAAGFIVEIDTDGVKGIMISQEIFFLAKYTVGKQRNNIVYDQAHPFDPTDVKAMRKGLIGNDEYDNLVTTWKNGGALTFSDDPGVKLNLQDPNSAVVTRNGNILPRQP